MKNGEKSTLAEFEKAVKDNPNSLETWLEKLYFIESLKKFNEEELLDEYIETSQHVVALIGDNIKMIEAFGQHIYPMAKEITLYCIGEVERDFESVKQQFVGMTEHYERLSANEEMGEEIQDQYFDFAEKESQFMHELFEINNKAYRITQTIPLQFQIESTLLGDLDTDFLNLSNVFSEKEQNRREVLMKYEEAETNYLERHGDYLKKHGKMPSKQTAEIEDSPYIPDSRETKAINLCNEMGVDSALAKARKMTKNDITDIDGHFLLMIALEGKREYNLPKANQEYLKSAKSILSADIDENCRETVYRMAAARATEVARYCQLEITKNIDTTIAQYNEMISYYNSLSGKDEAEESITDDFKEFKNGEDKFCKVINKIIDSGDEIESLIPEKLANAWAHNILKDYFDLHSQFSDKYCERMDLGSMYYEAKSSYHNRCSEMIHKSNEMIQRSFEEKRSAVIQPASDEPEIIINKMTITEQEKILKRSDYVSKIGVALLAIIIFVFLIYMLINWSFVLSMFVGIPLVGIVVYLGLKVVGKVSDNISSPVHKQQVQEKIQEMNKNLQQKEEQLRKKQDDDYRRMNNSIKDNVIQANTTTITIDDNNWIIVNEHAEKIIINHHLYNFKDIIDYQITDDAQSIQHFNNITSTSETHTSTGDMLGRAAVGSILGGTAGAIIGGATAKKSTTTITPGYSVKTKIQHNYRIDVTINNLSHPLETMLLGDNTQITNQVSSLLGIIVARNR